VRFILSFLLLLSTFTMAHAGEITYGGYLTPITFHSPVVSTEPCQTASSIDTTWQSYYLHAQVFSVTESGVYTILNTRNNFGRAQDSVLLLYRDWFNPNQPLQNLIGVNDDPNNTDSLARLDCSLTAGVRYILVTTTYEPGVLGRFSNQISGPGTINIRPNYR